MYFSNQLFLKTPHETLKFQEKFKKNVFSSDLQTQISKSFSSLSTMGQTHGAIKLSKQ